MKKLLLLLVVFLATSAPAWALKDRLQDGSAGQKKTLNTPMKENIDLKQIQEIFTNSDSRANHKEYTYSPDITMKLRLREYMNTSVVLPEGENIKAYSLGDGKNFSFSAVRLTKDQPTNIFEVWGKFPGADTSLKVYGESGQIYVFYLKIDSVASKEHPTLIVYVNDPDLKDFQSSFTGTKKSPKKSKYTPKNQDDTETPDYLRSLKDANPADLNFAYQVADNESELAPIRIFDDGHFTYFQFGEENLDSVRNLPAFYRVVDGTDQPFTNLQKEGGFVIATTTHDRWTLKSGRKWLCIRVKK